MAPRPKLYPTSHKNLKRTTKRARAGTEYYADFYVGPKKRIIRPLGTDEEEARAELAQLMRRHRKNADKLKERPAKLSELQARHRDAHSSRVGKQQATTWGIRDRNAVKGLKDQPPEKIKREAILAWLGERIEIRKPATVNGDLVRLGQVLGWAVERGWLTENPAQGIPYYRVEESRIRYLLADEEERLKAVCKPEKWDWIRFAYLTGLRQGEQLSLSWSQIAGGQIRLEGTETKSYRRRAIPISKTTQEILERRKRIVKGSLIFPSPKGRVWETNNFRERFWKPLFDAAQLVDFVWHDLRHTFCSRLVMAGASLVAVRELAGHRRFETTLKYAHLAPGYLRDTAELLE